jgi:hypothetical protein
MTEQVYVSSGLSSSSYKTTDAAQALPIILYTWETEIRMIAVEGQSGKKFRRLHLNQALGEVVHACHPSNDGKCKVVGSWSRFDGAKK